MGKNRRLMHLIESYEALAAQQDAEADRLVTETELVGWDDDRTQAIDMLRQQSETSRYLAQEVRDGMAE